MKRSLLALALLLVLPAAAHTGTGDLVPPDRVVDVLDVQTMVRQLLGLAPTDPEADIDSSGSLDILDVQAAVAIILGHRPAIFEVQPDPAAPGASVTITGQNFSSGSPGNHEVHLHGQTLTPTAATATSLEARAPTGLSGQGEVSVTLLASGLTSNALPLTIGSSTPTPLPDRLLVLYQTSGLSFGMTAANELEAVLVAAGRTVGLVPDTLPSDLAPYGGVIDLRFEVPLGAAGRNALASFLQSGRGVAFAVGGFSDLTGIQARTQDIQDLLAVDLGAAGFTMDTGSASSADSFVDAGAYAALLDTPNPTSGMALRLTNVQSVVTSTGPGVPWLVHANGSVLGAALDETALGGSGRAAVACYANFVALANAVGVNLAAWLTG